MNNNNKIKVIGPPLRENRESFEDICSNYRNKVYAISLMTLMDHNEAEKATEKIFKRAYGELGSLKYEDFLDAWIQHIAVDECNRIFRSRYPGTVEYEDILFSEDYDDFLMPEKYMKRQELADFLERLLDDLPLPQRQALVLSIYNELSTDDISVVTDSPVDMVQSRLRYATAYIKTEIREHELSGLEEQDCDMVPFSKVFTNYMLSRRLTPEASKRIWSVIYNYMLSCENTQKS